jgi:hypothetical protein
MDTMNKDALFPPGAFRRGVLLSGMMPPSRPNYLSQP